MRAAGRCRAAAGRRCTGPEFGSYPADDVTWLLKDLSGVALEAPVEEREAAVQAGTAHYAESLPIEYQPSRRVPGSCSAPRWPSRRTGWRTPSAWSPSWCSPAAGPASVLASLARAGTPIGILMRRWAGSAHGLDLPHYTVSIVRGRGIDRVALRYLAAHHDPADVVFVDGWTGKGAITRELAAALAEREPGRWPAGGASTPTWRCWPTRAAACRLFGTRDDFLIPSACLNSTVSGLVSRTVLNDALIGPADFHGAKFYAELAGADVSIALHRRDHARASPRWPRPGRGRLAGAARPATGRPTGAAGAACGEVAERYGIGDVNLVKPGVGETTRVLLRRVPWRVLVRTGDAETSCPTCCCWRASEASRSSPSTAGLQLRRADPSPVQSRRRR